YEEESAEDIQDRNNYRRADNRNYMDGDSRTNIADGGDWEEEDNSTEDMYAGDATSDLNSRVSDRTRVYKGGSWRDRAHWLSPGNRRYLHEEEARDDIGFRCAMTRVGTPAKRD
ncbi:MAG: gliding motility lipoprotein GldJ, partial [Marinilabilia sp.]